MSKDIFQESREAAIALAEKLGVTLEQLQMISRNSWKKLTPHIAKIAKDGANANPSVVQLDDEGKITSVVVYKKKKV